MTAWLSFSPKNSSAHVAGEFFLCSHINMWRKPVGIPLTFMSSKGITNDPTSRRLEKDLRDDESSHLQTLRRLLRHI